MVSAETVNGQVQKMLPELGSEVDILYFCSNRLLLLSGPDKAGLRVGNNLFV
jgi:hypothetical protein